MKKIVISGVLAVCAAAPLAEGKQFTATEVAGVRLKGSGKIVISNDETAIRATAIGGKRKTTLVEVRSIRRAPEPRTVVPATNVSQARHVPSASVPSELATIFVEAAQRYSLDPLLLTAVARQESRFKPHAVSPVGARGVMQLMPRTAAWLGVTNPFDARQNIFGGAKYLKMMLDQFRGDVNLSLAAYNAGPGAVRKHRGIPPYRETTAYVAAIRRDYETSRR